jgi:phospholipid transport system transporter-binding protein
MVSSAAFKVSSAVIFNTVQAERARFLEYCRESSNEEVVVDLETLEHCDSAGLAFLIEVKRIAQENGRVSKIINMPEETQALAEFYGISALLGATDIRA